MADRVAVFNRGRIEQLDTPRTLYTRPATAFVARFVGGANVVTGELAQRLSGRADPFAVRAENIRLRAPAAAPDGDMMSCIGDVADVQYHGAMSRWQVRLESGEVFAAALADTSINGDFKVGARVRLEWSRADVVPLAAAEST
jgi:putative spermidine/putrescine transport system ATP-binding protein